MLSLMKNLNSKRFNPIHFVVAETDITSQPKIEKTENFQWSAASSNCNSNSWYRFHSIKRSREVGQSWFTTVFTTFLSIVDSLVLVLKLKPDVVLCNGPGTCIPVCIGALLLRVFCITDPVIIFVESFCRVKSLSLSGRIMYPVADRFIVQWPGLVTYDRPRCEYIGTIF
mmetsp:Transcript_17917/g.22845  ORF Transcript_17917/g.22845 Transcript_17917/m.22845 type:complete len:170 (+) Transcript_17917:242-751(+)